MRSKKDLSKYRDEMAIHSKIRLLIGENGPLTVSDISNALNVPSDEIMMYVMAMRRYGIIEEEPKSRRDMYFKYGLANAYNKG